MTAPWNFPALFATLVIEGLGLVLWNKRKRRAWMDTLPALILINLLTQWILFSGLVRSPLPYWPTLLGLEAAVFLLEAAGYRLAGLSWRSAFLLSLILNLASFLAGLGLPF